MAGVQKVEIVVLVTVNDRPIWRKAKKVKPDLAGQLRDEELYDKVLWCAENELRRLLTLERKPKAPEEKEPARK